MLEFFGVSLAVVEFVGGLVIATVGWQMLVGEAGKDSENAAGQDAEDIYFSLLAFPLLAGPGAGGDARTR